jgi:hypothetical protein
MTDQPVDGVSADEGKQPGLIPFRLRIGVIGHIKLTDSEELRQGVRQAIELAIEESGYRAAERPDTGITLTVVSALAEGADRIVTKEVLSRPGSKLLSVLPVYEQDIDVYRSDFADDQSRADFDCYYRRAWRHLSPPQGAIPDEHTGEARIEGYLWAGLAVVRNCDVLIALWDEEGSRGTGGTADVIGRLRERDRRISDAGPPTETGLTVRGAAASLISPARDEPLVLETAGPLRIIVPVKGDHTPWVDDEPPFKAAADAVRRRLASDLNDLDRLTRKQFSAANWTAAENDTAK